MMERLVIITGLSGSGKVPGGALPRGHELLLRRQPARQPRSRSSTSCSSGAEARSRSGAIVVDARERAFLAGFPETLDTLRRERRAGHAAVLRMHGRDPDARFSETRRPHPMQDPGGSLEKAIQDERAILARCATSPTGSSTRATSTRTSCASFLKASFGQHHAATTLNVHVVSFGFKYGVPAEADLLFDVRFIPNPYFVDGLRRPGRPARGRSRVPRRRARSRGSSWPGIKDLLDFLIPHYASEGKSYLTITIGCTGGKHRSVALAEEIREHFVENGVPVSVTHRDLGKE